LAVLLQQNTETLKQTSEALRANSETMAKVMQELADAKAKVSALEAQVAAQAAQITTLQQYNSWMHEVVRANTRLSRQSRIAGIERNIILFPARARGSPVPEAFIQATSNDRISATLGLPTGEVAMVLERGHAHAFVRVALPSLHRKRQVLRWESRNAIREQHHVVAREELLPEELAEHTHLRPTMQALYAAGLRPTWRRSTVAWRAAPDSAVWCEFTALDVPQSWDAAKIVARAREMMATAMSTAGATSERAGSRPQDDRRQRMDTRADHLTNSGASAGGAAAGGSAAAPTTGAAA
jgi:hypothetical protein